MNESIVVYDTNDITAVQIAQTINEKTPFEAKVVDIGSEDPSKIPKSCGFLGFFCD